MAVERSKDNRQIASMSEAMASPEMRALLGEEALQIYGEALRILGVPEEDIERNVEAFRASRMSARKVLVAYESKKASSNYQSKIY